MRQGLDKGSPIMDGCYDKIRYSLSDESGQMRFESFEFLNMPECAETLETLRDYLLSRPLCQVDPQWVRSLQCQGNGRCMSDVARVIEEHQQLFGSPMKDDSGGPR